MVRAFKRAYVAVILTARAARRRVQSAFDSAITRAFLPRIVSSPTRFRAAFGKPPTNALVFPSNICNALCSFCAYPTNRDPKHSMSEEIAALAIDGLIEAGGGQSICFTPNLGDPLVDPNLAHKLAYAKMKGVGHTYFYTNGILLARPGLIEAVAPNLDEILISLPGLDRENYREIFRVDKAQKLEQGLLKLAAHRRATGMPKRIVLEFRVNRPFATVMNDPGLIALQPFIDDGTIVIGSVIEDYDNWGGTIDESEMTGTMRMKEVTQQRDMPCAMLTKNPGILPDGHLRACSCWYANTNYDGLTLPKISDQPLKDILYGEDHRNIFVNWLAGSKPSPCDKCSYYAPVAIPLRDAIAALNAK